MATSAERRIDLQMAVKAAARRLGVTLSPELVHFFVDRALGHIETRYQGGISRDIEVERAVDTAPKLIKNLISFTEKRTGTISESEGRDYVQRSAACFYPWCKPEPE